MLNKTLFQGRNVADIELRQTTSGISVCEFTLVWSEKYKETEIKCFLRARAWRNTAEFLAKYLGEKGQEMLLEGRLITEEWEKDGKKQSRTMLDVEKAHFCGSKNTSNKSNTTKATSVNFIDEDEYMDIEDEDGDLPF